jgi:hypothetical protein
MRFQVDGAPAIGASRPPLLYFCKVEDYFDRTRLYQWEFVIIAEVGTLPAEIYAKYHRFAARDSKVSGIKAQKLKNTGGNADDGHSDEDREKGD